jgi:hypothetical protein
MRSEVGPTAASCLRLLRPDWASTTWSPKRRCTTRNSRTRSQRLLFEVLRLVSKACGASHLCGQPSIPATDLTCYELPITTAGTLAIDLLVFGYTWQLLPSAHRVRRFPHIHVRKCASASEMCSPSSVLKCADACQHGYSTVSIQKCSKLKLRSACLLSSAPLDIEHGCALCGAGWASTPGRPAALS